MNPRAPTGRLLTFGAAVVVAHYAAWAAALPVVPFDASAASAMVGVLGTIYTLRRGTDAWQEARRVSNPPD